MKLICKNKYQNKKQFMKSRCYWITGLSASGKTTMANMLTSYLKKKNKPVIQLDGDILRNIFNIRAYSLEERYSLGLKYSFFCKLIREQNINVVIGVIGLFHKLRTWNRKNIPNYCEIFLNTPLQELINRDPKGIYKRALNGNLKNVAGIDLKIELPRNPDVEIIWSKDKSVESTFKEIIKKLKNKKLIF